MLYYKIIHGSGVTIDIEIEDDILIFLEEHKNENFISLKKDGALDRIIGIDFLKNSTIIPINPRASVGFSFRT